MHYYDNIGNPCYEIRGKNGKMRTPYAKEAIELGLAPGVTSITGQVGSENLVEWKVNLVLDLAANHPLDQMCQNIVEWKKTIKQQAANESKRITTQGHAIHDALEQYYLTGKLKDSYRDFIVPVIALIEREWPNLQRTDWIPERSFQYRGIFGGKVDLSTEGEGGVILDFKTKDSTDVKKFKAYSGHHQQLVAYAHGLQQINSKCGNIFLSALEPGIVQLEMHDKEVLAKSWYEFKALCKYWHSQKFKREIDI